MYQASKLLPLDVHVMSKSGDYKIDAEFAEGCLNLKGLNLVKFVFTKMLPKDSSIVLDPMCGMGYTAQATVDAGLSFRGNELNQKRLEKTIKRLQK
jgi:DNA modification methylase